MKNPFKFGTVVDNEYFTDRINECEYITRFLSGENHLILISPRRFGKSSLVAKAVKQTGRKSITINMQNVTSVQNFSSRLMSALLKLYPIERIKHVMSHFRFVPSITTNIVTGNIDVAFMPNVDPVVLLEDAMELLERVSSQDNRMIVVLDEFQDVLSIAKGFDKQLRSIMQLQKNVNYIFLGSQESMMEGIFEKKKSPFYHFGQLMRLDRIPYDDFFGYVSERLPADVSKEILTFTHCHPYYTQQLAYHVWDMLHYESVEEDLIELTIERMVNLHDLDFERLWTSLTRQERRIMQVMSEGKVKTLLKDQSVPTSTTFSALKKLVQKGYVIKTTEYEIEDPFFGRWIKKLN
ncbi:MAG: ATP-binding protein [Bacteroidales bacterium]|nr:ATP-binding protein [Candidatus Sodaliphilus fimicaballi]